MIEKRPMLSIKRKPTNTITKAANKPSVPPKQSKPPEAMGKPAKSLTEAPVASGQPTLSKAERTGRNRAKKIRQGEAALPLLILLWPSVFSLTAPKPLKIGIKEDVIAYAAERGIVLSKAQIMAALMVYTNRPEYRSAVAQGGQRVDLHGHPAGEVGEKAVEHTRMKLAKLAKKAARIATESDFKRMAEDAAEQEKAGNLEAAGKLWLEALGAAKKKANQHWCEVR